MSAVNRRCGPFDPAELIEVAFRAVGARGWAAVFEAYLDASGTHPTSSLVCVAGLLFDKAGADEFARLWSPEVAGLARPFRTAACQAGRRPFEDWDQGRRHRLLDRLADIIAATRGPGFVTAIEPAEVDNYAKLNPDIASLAGSAYSLCLLRCVEQIGSWVSKHGGDKMVAYLFEAGDSYEREAADFMRRLRRNDLLAERCRVASYGFAEKKNLPIFDASDLLAWEWQHWILKRQEPASARLRTLADKSRYPLYAAHLTEKSIAIRGMINTFYQLHCD